MILTDVGQTKLAAAASGGAAVDIVDIAIGDANNASYTPDGSETALVNEVWRGDVHDKGIVSGSPNTAYFESVIPPAEGGWFMYEIGLFDAAGDMIAIGALPGWNKVISEIALEFVIKAYLAVNDVANLELVVDPTLYYLTSANILADENGTPAENANKAMPWGSYGIGAWKPIADADLATRGGLYSLPLALGAANAPEASASGVVIAVNGGADDDYIFQIWGKCNDTDDEAVYIRHRRGETPWTSWTELWSNKNLVKQETAEDATAGRVMLTGAHPTVLKIDPLRRSVEAASGGRQTVVYTAKGEPCYMHVIPKFNVEDVTTGGELGTGVHPAFVFAGGEVSEILVSSFQAASVAAEAVCQPGLTPVNALSFVDARALAQANGPGFDIMSNWDWAALALWCMKNGYEPTGNTDYGRHHTDKHQTGILLSAAGVPGDSGSAGRSKTGSGPNDWSHDLSPAGIKDLVGNVWEWVSGFKIIDGSVYIGASNAVLDDAVYYDTSFVLPTSREWSTVDNTFANDLIKQALIAPKGVLDPSGDLQINLSGERFPMRGGAYDSAGAAGLGALNLNNAKTASGLTQVGFRVRYKPL